MEAIVFKYSNTWACQNSVHESCAWYCMQNARFYENCSIWADWGFYLCSCAFTLPPSLSLSLVFPRFHRIFPLKNGLCVSNMFGSRAFPTIFVSHASARFGILPERLKIAANFCDCWFPCSLIIYFLFFFMSHVCDSRVQPFVHQLSL